MPSFYAHSGKLLGHSDWQLLHEHLKQVALGAADRAREACPTDIHLVAAAHAAGLLHDLGKYRPEFQQMLEKLPVPREQTYHKQAGAAKAFDGRNAPVAFAVAGHHGGMLGPAALKDLVAGPSGRPVAAAVWATAVSDCPPLGSLCLDCPAPGPNPLRLELFTRLVFSCLVDADWADTSAHARKANGLPPEPPAPRLDTACWLQRVLAYIRQRAADCIDERIARIRDDVLRACLVAADAGAGLFSLTVPTGGGKTLSGLAFALKHAGAHGLRRIIYVAPYLSILDQNARVLRAALNFGPDAPELFEHHSLAEPPGDQNREETSLAAAVRRAESWDAPVIVTTNVQFFESILSNRPGRCRKLHNIARSVVILDECQCLPPDLVAPTCCALGQLVEQLGCSIVLCTATQPAFDHADIRERLVGVREIIPAGMELFRRLRRVHVDWPKPESTLDCTTVAALMRAKPAALCIVNTKRAARDVFTQLGPDDGDAFHLSTAMCPAHRLMVLDAVQARLKAGQPCYLVSTQLIEAGVDVDFPYVMRELAPLESIIQSAGRCNREGLLKEADGSPGGKVVVFRSVEDSMPSDRWYRAGRAVLEGSFLNNQREPRIDDPAVIREYFERLYRTGSLDQRGIQADRRMFEFSSVADKYRLIEDNGVPVAVASWEEKCEQVEELLQVVRLRPSRAAFRRLAPFQLNLRHYELVKLGAWAAEEAPGLWVWRGGYDSKVGVTAEQPDKLFVV